MIIDNIRQYSFAKATYFDTYVRIEFNSDLKEVLVEQAQLLLKDMAAYYGGQKFVIISQRGLETNLDPEILKILNLSKVEGLAIVSPDAEERRKILIKEQSLFEGSFAYFETYEAAREWALTF
ncbi:hypothetical protein [Leeuwenhoekiella sp. MAR_2009_132]|uniref:hypothetical protein n=1 Tax=Leeuwenhoekiella sp. MAR_2009_132 TaxID=1392489 RepID=UPI00048DEE04|nr:hypothetical protein [Leeuwenhoekiella sp. MAR_2009_132]